MVRVPFAGTGEHRDYLIAYKPRHVSRSRLECPARMWVRSFADASVNVEFDLRDPKDAAALERSLFRGHLQLSGAAS